METEHTETVVEKVTSYVKDMLGIPQTSGHSDSETKPKYEDIAAALHFGDTAPTPLIPAPDPTTEDAMRLEPSAYTTKTVGDYNRESARRAEGE